jgi:hypothetical protein
MSELYIAVFSETPVTMKIMKTRETKHLKI